MKAKLNRRKSPVMLDGLHVRLKLNQRRKLAMHDALQMIDGYDRVVRDGTGERVIREYYTLGSARLAIAKNINVITEALEVFETARISLTKEVFGDMPVEARGSSEQMKDFVPQFQKMMDTEEEIDLYPIKSSELRLDINNLPVLALSALEPIITDT